MQQEKRRQEKLQLQLAGDFVDDIVGHTLFRLDVDLAGLDAHFMGGAVVGLCALDDIGDVVLDRKSTRLNSSH